MTDPDFFPTPREAVRPLLTALAPGTRFVEPCAGNGALRDALEAEGHVCAGAYDVNPRAEGIRKLDARHAPPIYPDLLITNPPYTRSKLVALLDDWVGRETAWLLLPIDRLATAYFQPYVGQIDKVVTVGRVRWVPGTPDKSTRAYAWVRFSREGPVNFFVPRA